MTTEAATDTASLSLSESAARRIAVLIEQDGNAELKLRVSVSGGGCSGFQYAFSLDSDVKDDEIAVERDGVTMIVDPISLMYIAGSEVDYLESIGGSYFVINNPKATSMCGCGNSFGIAI